MINAHTHSHCYCLPAFFCVLICFSVAGLPFIAILCFSLSLSLFLVLVVLVILVAMSPLLASLHSVPLRINRIVLSQTREWREWKREGLLRKVLIDFTPFTELVDLNMDDCGLVYFPCLPPSLHFLSFQSNHFPAIQSLPPELLTLNCSFCDIVVFPELPAKLSVLDCMECGLVELPPLPNQLMCLNFSNLHKSQRHVNRIWSLPDVLPETLAIINASQNADLVVNLDTLDDLMLLLCRGCPTLNLLRKQHASHQNATKLDVTFDQEAAARRLLQRDDHNHKNTSPRARTRMNQEDEDAASTNVPANKHVMRTALNRVMFSINKTAVTNVANASIAQKNNRRPPLVFAPNPNVSGTAKDHAIDQMVQEELERILGDSKMSVSKIEVTKIEVVKTDKDTTTTTTTSTTIPPAQTNKNNPEVSAESTIHGSKHNRDIKHKEETLDGSSRNNKRDKLLMEQFKSACDNVVARNKPLGKKPVVHMEYKQLQNGDTVRIFNIQCPCGKCAVDCSGDQPSIVE